MNAIILTNVSGSTITINDLGINVEDGESIDLNENFFDENLIESIDLQLPIDSGDVTIEINNVSSTYNQLIEFLTKLNEFQHESLVTLTHDLYKNSFFKTTKDVNGRVIKITNFTDPSESQKIYEEEITRDINSRVSSIRRSLYNSNGVFDRMETQTLNRNINGRVESITHSTT